MTETRPWRRCNACKEPIALGAPYWVCNVSTCNQKRTGMAFCSVSCWEVHLPSARHREAWAVEKTAPREPEPAAPARPAPASAAPRAPRRIIPSTPAPREREAAKPPKEVLIIASRLKAYVAAVSGLNTSDRVLGPLSEIVRKACDEAIRAAARDERKTVLDRDVPKP